MYNDCHVHCTTPVDGGDLLRRMDECEMDKALVCAMQVRTAADFAPSIDAITRTCAADLERLIGFAWVEPTLPEAVDHVRIAVDRGLRGVKMIPDHWYPYEERLFPVYEEIQRARKPILFHSGILFLNMDSSRFCRPVNFEAMLHFPKVKFALAHIGWPWTDECIAVFGRMRAGVHLGEVDECQMYIDITRGTPDDYRVDALRKALNYAGPERLMYGSDSRAHADLAASLKGIDADRRIICGELGYSPEDFRKVAADNLDDFLTPFD